MSASSVQLDLFLDSRTVVLANEAIDALLAAESPRAAAAIEQLESADRRHQAIAPLRRLLRELLEPAPPVNDVNEVAAAVQWLEREVEPAAREALGDRAAEFLAQRWMRLAQAPGAQGYDERLPHAYRASLYLRCERPDAAMEAAKSIPGWEANADALRWLAIGSFRATQAEQALQAAMRLALTAPAHLATVLEQIDDELMERDYAAFQAQCDWLADDASAATWFRRGIWSSTPAPISGCNQAIFQTRPLHGPLRC